MRKGSDNIKSMITRVKIHSSTLKMDEYDVQLLQPQDKIITIIKLGTCNIEVPIRNSSLVCWQSDNLDER